MDINDKLKEIMQRRADIMLGAQWRVVADAQQRRAEEIRATGVFEIDKVVQGGLVEDASGAFYRVCTDYPPDTLQGSVALETVLNAVPQHLAFSALDDALDLFDPLSTCFIDTETSGLAGGTGTMAFLVGVGYFVDDVFRLEQCFLRDFDDEEPMLRYLDGLFARFETVVSYNGKSFDIPLLRTRFISNRLPFRLDGTMHYDLVHAARRFWKLRLKDCSLGNIEREVLGIERVGDVPGCEIPQLWFDYLRTRDARPLERVFYHHRMDILSLVALAGLISQNLDMPEGTGFDHAEDRLSLLRMHFRLKRYDEVTVHALKIIEADTAETVRRNCMAMLGHAYKQLQDWQRMEETWELMLTEFPSELLPRLELAKHHEHRTKDIARALRLCEEAFDCLQRRSMPAVDFGEPGGELEAVEHRLNRLREKLGKLPPTVSDEP
jgi:hypothetical protein